MGPIVTIADDDIELYATSEAAASSFEATDISHHPEWAAYDVTGARLNIAVEERLEKFLIFKIRREHVTLRPRVREGDGNSQAELMEALEKRLHPQIYAAICKLPIANAIQSLYKIYLSRGRMGFLKDS